MKNTRSIFFGLLAGLSLLQGCASTTQKKLDEKLSMEKEVPTQAELSKEAGQLIEKAPGLSAEQRAKLASVRDKLQREITAMRDESLKLRSILLKDVISANYDQDEVNLIKQRLESVEKKRLSTIFDSIREANAILGHQAPEHERIIRDLFPGRTS